MSLKQHSISTKTTSQEKEGKQPYTVEDDSLTNSSEVLKIDVVTFSLSKSKNKHHLIGLLKHYYGFQKTQKGTDSKQFGPLQTSTAEQPLQKISIQHSQQFKLQNVKLEHFHSVFSTEQTSFSLRRSQYKRNKNISESLFKFDSLIKIQFINLEKLDLSCSKLSSVEKLSFIDMPQLKRLELHENKISKFNALSKCVCKNLEYISCQDNPIVQNSMFYRGFFPKLNRIILDSDKIQSNLTRETYKNLPDQNTMPNIDYIFKTPNLSQIKQLKLNSRKRIFPLKFKLTLKSINPQIKLKSKLTNEDLMNRLERLGGIGRNNDPVRFRRFLEHEVQPVLLNREQNNPNHVQAINQIRQGLAQRLQWLILNAPPPRRPLLNQTQNQEQPNQLHLDGNTGNVQNPTQNEARILQAQIQE